ncbi:MAG: YdcH family protein [Aquificota bacterium]|nr:YdcH family protein [Aquificota bacterium]
MNRDEIVEKLYREDPQFREWKDRHDELDKQVAKLERHHPMTHDLQLEIEKLKKQKLRYKDLMEEKIREFMKSCKG